MEKKNMGERSSFFKVKTRPCESELAVKFAADEPPLRSELFTNDQMVRHGKFLAGSHEMVNGYPKSYLLKRLDENENLLLQVHSILAEDIRNGKRTTPAVERLLDNFYLIEQQIRTAKRHLPKGYSRELPHLSKGDSAGLPRVYYQKKPLPEGNGFKLGVILSEH